MNTTKKNIITFICLSLSTLCIGQNNQTAASGSQTAQIQAEQSNNVNLGVDDFEKAIQEKGVTIIDVRRQDEYEQGHIEKAININVLEADFAEKANKQLKKGQKVAVYCKSGRRSKKAVEILQANGYNVVELNCGINCWILAQKKIVK